MRFVSASAKGKGPGGDHSTERVALVTGAAKRVGRAIAVELVARGYAVAVHCLGSRADADALVADLAARGGKARVFAADSADADAGPPARRRRGRLGRPPRFPGQQRLGLHAPGLRGGDDAAWEAAWADSLDVNLLAPARLSRRAAPHLRAVDGVIVNLVDVAAWQAWPGFAHYGAAKAGLVWLTRTLARALAPSVRVVGAAPGIAQFPDDLAEPARERLVAGVPLGRPVRPRTSPRRWPTWSARPT